MFNHLDNHSSRICVATYLKQPTRTQRGPRQCVPIWSCSEWGLPCHYCYQQRGALLPHHFTLTSKRRYIFCGTGRGFTSPRRYLAPCPAEPGLSSEKIPAIAQLTSRMNITQDFECASKMRD